MIIEKIEGHFPKCGRRSSRSFLVRHQMMFFSKKEILRNVLWYYSVSNEFFFLFLILVPCILLYSSFFRERNSHEGNVMSRAIPRTKGNQINGSTHMRKWNEAVSLLRTQSMGWEDQMELDRMKQRATFSKDWKRRNKHINRITVKKKKIDFFGFFSDFFRWRGSSMNKEFGVIFLSSIHSSVNQRVRQRETEDPSIFDWHRHEHHSLTRKKSSDSAARHRKRLWFLSLDEEFGIFSVISNWSSLVKILSEQNRLFWFN